MGDPSLPHDYQAFKNAILADAYDDWLGVYEVWWSANSRYPTAALSQRLAVAERVVAELLAEDRIRLYRGSIKGPSGDEITGPDATALLLDPMTWVPDSEAVLWLGTIDDATVDTPRSTTHQLEIGERPKRVFGRLKGQIVVHGDFDADNDEIAREFEESVAKPLEPSAS